MRALIRNGEIYTEDQWSSFTRTHLAFMTGTETDGEGNRLPGDGWTLVENYTVPAETSEATYDVVTEPQEQTETITIDGQEYSLDEVRAALQNTE